MLGASGNDEIFTCTECGHVTKVPRNDNWLRKKIRKSKNTEGTNISLQCICGETVTTYVYHRRSD